MTTKMAEETAVKEVVIPAPVEEVPEALKQQAEALTVQLTEVLNKQKEAYLKKLAAAKAITAGGVEAADPGLANYQYWNCLSFGPYQGAFTNPPYRPSKVIAAGEWALMRGLIWINDQNGPGGSLPGTIVLGDRQFRARFETINLSDVVNGPDLTWLDTFTSPAPEYYWMDWWFRAPDPGPTPNLYEMNLTIDLTLGGQPFAAFSNWHWDPDTEPPFAGIPARGPHWQFERPVRFMVYRK